MWILAYLWTKILLCQREEQISNKNVYFNTVKTTDGEIIFDVELQISNGGDSYTRDVFPYTKAQSNVPVVLVPPFSKRSQSFTLHVNSSYPDQTGRSRAEFKNKPGTYVDIRQITRFKYHTQFSIDELNGPDGKIAFFQLFSVLPSKPWLEFFWNAGDSYNYLTKTRCSRQRPAIYVTIKNKDGKSTNETGSVYLTECMEDLAEGTGNVIDFLIFFAPCSESQLCVDDPDLPIVQIEIRLNGLVIGTFPQKFSGSKNGITNYQIPEDMWEDLNYEYYFKSGLYLQYTDDPGHSATVTYHALEILENEKMPQA